MYQYDRDIALTNEGDLFHGELSGAWNIGENPNGGYLAAVALGAIKSRVRHLDPISVTTHYLRPGIGNEKCQVEVVLIREGRTLSTAQATLSQEGKPRLVMMAAMADLDQQVGVADEIQIPVPEMPSPDECIQRSGDIQGIVLPISQRLDTRLHPDYSEPGKAGEAVMSGWIRFGDGREPDTGALTLFCDAFPPSAFGLLGAVGWVPTIELTVHVRRKPVPGWICGRFVTEDLSGGRMIESGQLWDSAGNLVAQSCQIGMILSQD